MKKQLHTNRPAIAAIAAVLAFATSPAGAQPAPDVSADPAITQPESAPPVVEPAPAPEAVAPAEPAQSAPVQIAPQSEVVQAVPPSQAEPAAPARDATRARTVTTIQPAATKPAAAPSAPAEVPARPIATPVVTPDTQPAADFAQTKPAAQPTAPANPEVVDAAWWALGGGVLLFAGGLGALALSRSKKRPGAARADRTRDRAPATVQPAVAAEAAIAVPEPIVVKSKTPVRAARIAHSSWPELEKMVDQAPSPENPFLTRSKRMRRAKFLLEHEHEPKPAAQTAKHAAKEVKPQAKAEVKKAPAVKAVNGKANATYSFGSKAKPRTNWKPATT
ncbi:MAG TPA: hypothetical protein VGE65_04830 [Sphingobium sp.]